MASLRTDRRIVVVDDESESAILKAVRRRLQEEGWRTVVVEPESDWTTGEGFEAAALWTIEEEQPDGVLLDVRFGEHPDDRFRGLSILAEIVQHFPKLPVLMFTQYAQGPDRETAVRGALQWESTVDFIDKLASPEEVILRLRRLIGTTPDTISIGSRIVLDTGAKVVYVSSDASPSLARPRRSENIRSSIRWR